MCIIAYKPADVEISEEYLENMFSNNSDGAGVMYPENHNIIIKKGLMTLEEFLSVCRSIPKDVPAVYHCRIMSHGAVCKELTHPFPVVSDEDILNMTSMRIRKGYAVAHNGIINKMDIHGKNQSDTQAYIRDILAPLSKWISPLSDKAEPIIEKTIDSSRLAIMDTSGNVRLFGTGWEEENGVFYSNDSYSYSWKRYYKNLRYNDGWDDWYSDYYGRSSHYYGKSYRYDNDSKKWLAVTEDKKPSKVSEEEEVKRVCAAHGWYDDDWSYD